MLCSTNRPTSVRLTADLQPRPGLRSGKAELRKRGGPERMNICPFDALSPLFLPNSLVCPPLLFWEAPRAYCPLIFVDSLPRARFCNSLVALKSNRTGASATTVNMPQAECNAAGGPTLPLELTTDKGIRSRMVLGRCELASLVRGFSLFPQRTRLTCVNWGPRLSVIGRMASALWAWTAQMGTPVEH